MTSSQHDPYALGYTHATMTGTEGSQAVMRSQSQKAGLSSDCGLQLAHMKLDSVVIACHKRAVNTSLLLAHTARQTNRAGSR